MTTPERVRHERLRVGDRLTLDGIEIEVVAIRREIVELRVVAPRDIEITARRGDEEPA